MQYRDAQTEVTKFANKNNIPIRNEFENGTVTEIQYIENGNPVYYISTNLGAAQTVRADRLWPGGDSGLNLTGDDYRKLGVWGSGGVRLTHQEFNGRVFQIDSPSNISSHTTHVAGALISSGIESAAKGIAFQSYLNAYDWNNDEAEMATAAASGLEVSNHSYAQACGWFWNTWFGDVQISKTEDFKFGFYSIYTFFWDNIAYNAPNYLIVKAVGNDRNESCDPTKICYVWINGEKVINTEERDPDGGANGYDCIPPKGVAKNILTIGAVTELLDYTTPSDVKITDFSSWGPADDGRIKPDIVAKGVDVYSTDSDSDDDYTTYTGTSKAAPSVTGTLALLQQYYQSTHNSAIMRSATLKALVLHTANEAGTSVGPDYQYGWGLLNAERAASLITLDSYNNYIIDEQVLSGSGIFTKSIYSDGTKPLKITICWTDPPGIPVEDQLNPRTPMLINDIDLRVTKETNTFYPWKLDYNNPSNAATNSSMNNVDNVEQVYIASPTAGIYTIEVSHDGTLFGGRQAFSIIVSGNDESLIPEKLTIFKTYPNPFNPIVKISYGLPERANVKIVVHDIDGRMIAEYDLNVQDAGWHEFSWNALDYIGHTVGSGIYLLTIKAGDVVKTQKVTFLK
ncbi:MAG: S8 family serine peptidase [Planctomycetia bacterium]|nr:S8 family serine peptidase [Planctomycetia bacterium]